MRGIKIHFRTTIQSQFIITAAARDMKFYNEWITRNILSTFRNFHLMCLSSKHEICFPIFFVLFKHISHDINSTWLHEYSMSNELLFYRDSTSIIDQNVFLMSRRVCSYQNKDSWNFHRAINIFFNNFLPP